jgi:hypothetical protein
VLIQSSVHRFWSMYPEAEAAATLRQTPGVREGAMLELSRCLQVISCSRRKTLARTQ